MSVSEGFRVVRGVLGMFQGVSRHFWGFHEDFEEVSMKVRGNLGNFHDYFRRFSGDLQGVSKRFKAF